MTARARLAALFGVQEHWTRPRPTPGQRRNDLKLAFGFWLVAVLLTELVRVLGVLDSTSAPIWVQHLAVATGTLALAWRRRLPLVVGGYAGLHMFVVGVTIPNVMGLLPLQLAYFLALYTAVAWARDRQLMALVVGGVVTTMFLWLAVVYVWGSALEEMVGAAAGHSLGPLTPAAAAGIFGLVVNAVYFGGAVVLGQQAWRAARHTAQVDEQRITIQAQAQQLRDQAVTEERLRIARELHDVVAHHVSVMGVQAAAARTVLHRDPVRAAEALRAIEDSSREAVAQLRGLLGTLRGSTEATPDDTTTRAPHPGLPDLPALVESATAAPGLDVTYSLVEDPPGRHREVPPQVGLAIYRIVQEALTNVRRHSTARRASVVVRVAADYAEAEVLDDGRSRGPSTGGSGLGLLGVRERINSLGGAAEIGPRVTGGYRVRVRFPLALRPVSDSAAAADAGGAA